MKKNGAFRRAAALMAALSITVSLAAPAFAGTYYIDYGDITVTKDEDGKQTVQYSKEDGTTATENDSGEIIITTSNADKTTLESDLEGPAAEDTGFGPVVEDNYQPAQPEDAEEPEGADQPESTEEPEGADQPESAEEPKAADQPEGTDQPEDAEEPKAADQQENAEESENTNRQESADRQAQPQQAAPAAAPAASTPKNDKGNGFWGNTITVINKVANTVLNLTLRDVKIDVSDNRTYGDETGKAALSVQGKGSVEIELDGKNELKSGYKRAGLEKTSEGTLTLKDDKKKAGSLTATGGKFGAGIGGGNGGSGENITITGGTVTATGGYEGAGIGGGYSGSGENITITGGTVEATGGDFGAGIGGGDSGSSENITITGGTVTAKGGQFGAGIGGGNGGSNGGSGENITITGGTVNATGGLYGGAGIGGGDDGSGKNITINGGTVNTAGGEYGAGIGGGCWGSGEDITINGGTVNATGGTCGAGIGGGEQGNGGYGGIGSNVTVSGAAQVTAIAGKPDGRNGVGAGATIGGGGSHTVDSDGNPVPGTEIQADIKGLTTGYIHHIIYNLDSYGKPDGILKEWWEPEYPQPNPEDPNAPAEESNEVDLGTPWLHVETLEGVLLPFDAQQQGGTLRVTTDNLAARLHGTRQALEALREQGVEQIQFVTTLKTTTLSVEELLAEGGSWFALEHNGLGSRRLSAAQAESLKCRMR